MHATKTLYVHNTLVIAEIQRPAGSTSLLSVALRPASLRPAHPLGISTDFSPPLPHSAPASSFWKQSLHNVEILRWYCISESSRYTYQTGWNRWRQWATLFGTDPYMSIQPTCWLEASPSERCFYTFHESCALAFLAYLYTNTDIQPSTAIQYLSAAKFMLEASNINCSFFNTSIAIWTTKQSMLVG